MAPGPPALIGVEGISEFEEREHLMDKMHERPVVTSSNQDRVRQGETGHHVRYILIISCVLVIIAFIAIALFVRA